MIFRVIIWIAQVGCRGLDYQSLNLWTNMKNSEYDYLLVGAGLFNAIFAFEAAKKGKRCLVVEKRSHIGGNLYCENIEGINVHMYGPHIFHTNSKFIWEYMNSICPFNNFIYSPLANYDERLYSLPFNMYTFYQLWGTKTPNEAKLEIEKQKRKLIRDNLEDFAISIVGIEIYEKLIKGYTEKQWGKSAKELPSFIIKRLPLRFTYNNNYFNDIYQGIPTGGYNNIFSKCFRDSTIMLDTNYLDNKHLSKIADITIYTGMIDQFYNYCYDALEYRSLNFETSILNMEDFQGNAVINYTESDVPYTRIIEHKHFEFGNQNKTVITKEFPVQWNVNNEPFYPINTDRNQLILRKYNQRANCEKKLIFAGRLGNYLYYDMDKVVYKAIELSNKIILLGGEL